MSGATVTIDRLRATYGVAPGSDERRRLDRLLAIVAGGALETAVERAAPVGDDELVCVRRVDAPVRLALGKPGDHALAADWAAVIAAGIAARIDEGGPDVVRYGSRRHALQDMALALAAGDRTREWAWRSVGLWPSSEPVPGRALVAALVVEDGGASVAPVLAGVARRGRLGGLAAILAPGAWLTLAAAALRAAGAAEPAIERALQGDGQTAPPPADVMLRAQHESSIAAALRDSGAPVTAVAALALVEIDPGAVAAAGERLADVVAPAATPTPGDPPPTATISVEADDRDAAEIPERARATSAFGGLVFALHAVVALELPARFAALPRESDLRAMLHALALALAAVDPCDPAALAFAGVAPGREPPEVPDDEAQPAILAAAGEIRRWLAARLELEPDALDLDALLRRDAEIVADPGWIEVHMRLDEVDTATRRAGLDLDPGHLPFLGCVVRIVYA